MCNTFLHNPGSEASHHNIVMRYWYWRIKFNFQFTLFPFHTMIWEPRTQYAGTPTTAGGSRPRTARDWPWDAAYAGPLQSCHVYIRYTCLFVRWYLGLKMKEGWWTLPQWYVASCVAEPDFDKSVLHSLFGFRCPCYQITPMRWSFSNQHAPGAKMYAVYDAPAMPYALRIRIHWCRVAELWGAKHQKHQLIGQSTAATAAVLSMQAAREGDFQSCEWLSRLGPEEGHLNHLNRQTFCVTFRPFHSCAFYPDLPMRLLLEFRADPLRRRKDGQTAVTQVVTRVVKVAEKLPVRSAGRNKV